MSIDSDRHIHDSVKRHQPGLVGRDRRQVKDDVMRRPIVGGLSPGDSEPVIWRYGKEGHVVSQADTGIMA